MTYGHSDRAFTVSAAAVQRALVCASGTWGGYQAWRLFDPDRLGLIQPKPANDDTPTCPICEQPNQTKRIN